MKYLPLIAAAGFLMTGLSAHAAQLDAAPAAPKLPAPAPDNTSVPDTTVVDGKTVTLKKLPSGLRYYDLKVGTGPAVKAGDTVSVLYTGSLVDGSVFDSTAGHGNIPFSFPVGAGHVIKGWDEGIPGMKTGGKRRLVIPGNLAYGEDSPTAAIPANATLIFDVELVSFLVDGNATAHP